MSAVFSLASSASRVVRGAEQPIPWYILPSRNTIPHYVQELRLTAVFSPLTPPPSQQAWKLRDRGLAPNAHWYINVLAVRPQFRRQGLGTRLLALAEEIAHGLGKRGMSVIVSDANLGAHRLYERLGYNERARKLMVKDNWQNEGRSWVLLMKNL